MKLYHCVTLGARSFAKDDSGRLVRAAPSGILMSKTTFTLILGMPPSTKNGLHCARRLRSSSVRRIRCMREAVGESLLALVIDFEVTLIWF